MSNLIAGAFRFIDMSGCETTHSPKERTDAEVDAATAQEKGEEGSAPRARRGFAKVIGLDGSEKWAARADKAVYADAEKVLRDAQLKCRAEIWAVSVKVGSARAVPSRRYVDFTAARERCQAIVAEANASEQIGAANALLAAAGRPTMRIAFFPGLHPELTLADPEDKARAERLQQSVAESIALVIDAVRSQDRDRIRQTLESVGALAESVADPQVSGQVAQILTLAERTLAAQAALGRAQAASSRTTTQRGTHEAARRLRTAQEDLEAAQREAAQVADSLARFQLLDLQSDAEAAADLEERLTDEQRADRLRARLARADADRRGALLEVGDVVPQSAEDAAANIAAHVILQEQRAAEGAGRFGQLEIE